MSSLEAQNAALTAQMARLQAALRVQVSSAWRAITAFAEAGSELAEVATATATALPLALTDGSLTRLTRSTDGSLTSDAPTATPTRSIRAQPAAAVSSTASTAVALGEGAIASVVLGAVAGVAAAHDVEAPDTTPNMTPVVEAPDTTPNMTPVVEAPEAAVAELKPAASPHAPSLMASTVVTNTAPSMEPNTAPSVAPDSALKTRRDIALQLHAPASPASQISLSAAAAAAAAAKATEAAKAAKAAKAAVDAGAKQLHLSLAISGNQWQLPPHSGAKQLHRLDLT